MCVTPLASMTDNKEAPQPLSIEINVLCLDDKDVKFALHVASVEPSIDDLCQKAAEQWGCEWTNVVICDKKGTALGKVVLSPTVKAPQRVFFRVVNAVAFPEAKLLTDGALRVEFCVFVNRLFAELDALSQMPPEHVKIAPPSKEVGKYPSIFGLSTAVNARRHCNGLLLPHQLASFLPRAF